MKIRAATIMTCPGPAFAESVPKGTPIRNRSSEDALNTLKRGYQIYCAGPEWKTKWGREAFDQAAAPAAAFD
jgi:hypothetical protein